MTINDNQFVMDSKKLLLKRPGQQMQEKLKDGSVNNAQNQWKRGIRRYFSRYALLLLFFLVWEAISRSSDSIAMLLPPPTVVAVTWLELLRDGTLLADTIASLKRVGWALALASLIGFPLGVALGRLPRFSWMFEPIVNFFRPIPPLAWIPLSIVWFGIGDGQNVFIIFLGALFPIILNTMEGVGRVDQQLIRAARTLGANPLLVTTTVILPAALPSMFVGFRVGAGIAWMALVAGELVAATSGLGYLISQGRLLFRPDVIIVGMLMIGLIGLLLDALISACQRVVMPWRGDN